MCVQIQLLDVKNPNEDAKKIMDHKDALISFANTLCRNMCRRGGGVKDIRCRIILWNPHSYLTVYESNSINEHLSFLHNDENIYQIQHNFNFDRNLNNSQHVNKHDKKNEQHHNGNNQDYMLIVHIYIDVSESMGANLANTVAEGLAPKLADLIGARVGEFIFTSHLNRLKELD
jgi:hydroxymethylglutaryl-CoA reductase